MKKSAPISGRLRGGVWCSGSTGAFKALGGGSIPPTLGGEWFLATEGVGFPLLRFIYEFSPAPVVKLVDTADLGSVDESREGSTPSGGTGS